MKFMMEGPSMVKHVKDELNRIEKGDQNQNQPRKILLQGRSFLHQIQQYLEGSSNENDRYEDSVDC